MQASGLEVLFLENKIQDELQIVQPCLYFTWEGDWLGDWYNCPWAGEKTSTIRTCLVDGVAQHVPFPFICACMHTFPKVTFPIIFGDHKTSSSK